MQQDMAKRNVYITRTIYKIFWNVHVFVKGHFKALQRTFNLYRNQSKLNSN